MIMELFLLKMKKNKTQFKVNGQRLKPYIELENQNFPSSSTFEVHNFQDPSVE